MIDMNCVCEKPSMGSIPVNRAAPPPLAKQLDYLIEKVNNCAGDMDKLSTFLLDSPLQVESIEERCVSGCIAYVIRVIDVIDNKIQYLNEFCR